MKKMDRKQLQKMRKEIKEHIVNLFGKRIVTYQDELQFYEKGKEDTCVMNLRYFSNLHMLYVDTTAKEESTLLQEIEKEIENLFFQNQYPCLLLLNGNVSYSLSRMKNLFLMLSPLFDREDLTFQDTGLLYEHDLLKYDIKFRVNHEKHIEILFLSSSADSELKQIPIQTLTSQKQIFRFLDKLDKEAKDIERITEELRSGILKKPCMEFRKHEESEELVEFEIKKRWSDIEGEQFDVVFSSADVSYRFLFPNLHENIKRKILFTASRISESFSLQNEVEDYLLKLDPYFFVNEDTMFFLGKRYLRRFRIKYIEEKGSFLFENRNNGDEKIGSLEEIRDYAMQEAKNIYQEYRMHALYTGNRTYQSRIEFGFHRYTSDWEWKFTNVSEEEVEAVLQKEFQHTMVVHHIFETIQIEDIEFFHHGPRTIRVRRIREDEQNEQSNTNAVYETA